MSISDSPIQANRFGYAGVTSHQGRKEIYQANLRRHFITLPLAGESGSQARRGSSALMPINVYRRHTRKTLPGRYRVRPSVWIAFSLNSANFACAQGKGSAHATGYVHVQQIDGVWWFIGPDGDKFVSLGVNHIEPHLWLAPYNKAATLDRYGRDMVTAEGRFDTTSIAAKKWIDRQVEICGDLHFNTFGKHTHPSIDHALYRDQIYYVAAFETSPAARWHLQNGEGPLPDVFSEHFATFLTTRVEEVVSEHGKAEICSVTTSPTFPLGNCLSTHEIRTTSI